MGFRVTILHVGEVNIHLGCNLNIPTYYFIYHTREFMNNSRITFFVKNSEPILKKISLFFKYYWGKIRNEIYVRSVA